MKDRATKKVAAQVVESTDKETLQGFRARAWSDQRSCAGILVADER